MKITVKNRKKKEIESKEGQSILEALQENGVYVPALCAGRGTCGKCKVKILEGEVSSLEEASERREEIRLACKTCPLTDVVLELLEDAEENMVVEVADKKLGKAAEKPLGDTGRFNEAGIAVGDAGPEGVALVAGVLQPPVVVSTDGHHSHEVAGLRTGR